MRLYEAIAAAFAAEGVETVFSLTGDGNMHWEAALARDAAVHSYHVRHEHCACAMASAYATASGRVGVASVTCGPGLTQIMTALATAAQGHIPLVVFVGETPLHARWYNQAIDQAPLVTATGAHYITAHSLKQVMFQVAEAFFIARTQRRPVVIGVPLDMQQEVVEDAPYRPSTDFVPDCGPRIPHPAYLERAVARIRAARRIVVLAGRGAKASDAVAACVGLAERCDGALATTLPVRGLFAGHPRYVGIAGGFAHEVTREVLESSDLVIAVGASVSQHTSDSNLLFKPADVIQIDDNPPGIKHGHAVATLHLCADARLAVEALVTALDADAARQPTDSWDVQAFARRVRVEPAETTGYPVAPEDLDPRSVARALDAALPAHWSYVNAAGHCSYFATHLYDRPADNFLTIREFGAIGNGLSYAVGMAAAMPGEPVVLIEGDGGLMMHAQELETVARYGLKILVCVFNDGAYGSEIHKLRADRLSDNGAIYGRNDLARMARGFGLRGTNVTSLDQLPGLVKEFADGATAMMLDIRVSDQVMAPTMRRATKR